MGVVVLMKSGMDPFGALDFYGRMQYAVASGVPIDPGVTSEFGLNNVAQRLQSLWANVQLVCQKVPAVGQDCQAMHLMWHPDVTSSTIW
jgi:hypothetical protein